jgi:hypothetical protein
MPPKRAATLQPEPIEDESQEEEEEPESEEEIDDDDEETKTDSFVEEAKALRLVEEVFGTNMLEASVSNLPLHAFNNVWEIYDTFATVVLETNDSDEVTVFMEKYKKSLEIDVGFGKYDARGVVFASPAFTKDRKKEILDVDRLRVGPKLMEGVQQCITRSCRLQPSVVVSREKQVSSADEPSTFFHSCRRCGEQWRTRG